MARVLQGKPGKVAKADTLGERGIDETATHQVETTHHEQDLATTKDKSERMHQAIGQSELLLIPSAGHSSCVEKPEEVKRALQEFIHKPGT